MGNVAERNNKAKMPVSKVKAGTRGRAHRLRGDIHIVTGLLMVLSCLGLILLAWWWATRGETAEVRIVSPHTLPSPSEVFGKFHALWFEEALTRQTIKSVVRVLSGFGLAVLVGVPLGILAGCFPRFRAFMAPITVAGRNIPVAALVPLSLMWFGIDELQKTMFIFMACFAFVVFDTSARIASVDQKYVDTAYTLGASRWQVIFKVLTPLAAPGIFTSLRLLFGLAFGYIILAEMVNAKHGLGHLIYTSQRLGKPEYVYLTLIAIALVAYLIDRMIFMIGLYLFPYRKAR
jgi:ABC-type nitrate/sulfonate/bicarbonate transport system permease component